jgi:hypothetical protein
LLPLLASKLLIHILENKTLSSSEPNGLPHRFGFSFFYAGILLWPLTD